jgi:hypothetical protein
MRKITCGVFCKNVERTVSLLCIEIDFTLRIYTQKSSSVVSVYTGQLDCGLIIENI